MLTARRVLMVMLCGCFLLRSALAVLAQDGAASQGQAYTVHGSVVNKLNGQAIARALVALQGQSSNAVFTDSEGHFAFDNVPGGQAMITVSRPGFTGYAAHANAPEMRRVQVGANMADVTISLLPTGSIGGQITLSTSDSAENIQVFLLRRTIQNGRAAWMQSGVRRTNSDGAYLFGNLSPGDYRVYTAGSVDPAPGVLQDAVRWGFPPEYFPSGGESAIHLRAGQQAQADMMLTHEPFYPVTVAVTNGSPRGMGLQVYDGNGHMLEYPTRYDGREHVMRLNLPRGRFILEGQTFGMGFGRGDGPSFGTGFEREQMFGSREITVQNGALDNVALAMAPLNAIPVTVRREFTAQSNSAGGFISGSNDAFSAGVTLMLIKAAGSTQGFGGGNMRRVPGSTDNSSYQLENVRPGSYWVVTSAFQGYVASITCGGTDLARQPLVVGPGGAPCSIDVVLRNDGASLKIGLNQGASSAADSNAPPAYLSVVPQFETTWQHQGQMQLTQSGTTLSNLPPGSYRVLAFDEPQELEYSNPQAMSVFAGKGQVVNLEPGGSASVSLDVIAAGSQSQ